MLESIEDVSAIDIGDDENVADNIEEKLYISDTEQEALSKEGDSNEVSSHCTGKDNKAIGRQTKTNSRSRTRTHNIGAEQPGIC